MEQEVRRFPRWAKTECDECGCTFQVTRTESREFTGPVICGDCEMYQRGYEDGKKESFITHHETINGQPLEVYSEVANERIRQNVKWGGPDVDDSRKDEIAWIEDIEGYLAWAKQMHRMGSPEKYRRRMMQVAALAVAACESFDRQRG